MLSRRDLLVSAGAFGAGVLFPGRSPGAATPTDWPQFRGAQRDNISREIGLARKWPAAGPKMLWSVPVAQGYAGPAIAGGRIYHHDYDEAQFRANHVARHALQHEHLNVADAAERIESLLACGCPNAMELRIALRSLATSVDRMQDAAMRRAGHLL